MVAMVIVKGEGQVTHVALEEVSIALGYVHVLCGNSHIARTKQGRAVGIQYPIRINKMQSKRTA